MNDWTGNARSIFATHGASNHSDTERVDLDYYATDPAAVEALLKVEREFSGVIWEPACGGGHISEVLRRAGYEVYSTDIAHRGYERQRGTFDFLKTYPPLGTYNEADIITNPPYKFAAEFAQHALDISADGVKVAMLLKLTFLEGAKRKALFDINPPKYVYVFRNRIDCWRNGVQPEKAVKAVCYAWFIWQKGYTGEPTLRWIESGV